MDLGLLHWKQQKNNKLKGHTIGAQSVVKKYIIRGEKMDVIILFLFVLLLVAKEKWQEEKKKEDDKKSLHYIGETIFWK